MKLDRTFYTREDVVQIARDLIGKLIVSKINGFTTSAVIIETEAYAGAIDRASHAWNNRRTARTEIMFGNGGMAYIYLCYGIHHLFNFVTGEAGLPHAVLLRGIYPMTGLDVMEKRTGKVFREKGFGDGPGKASKALGLHVGLNGEDLIKGKIYVEDIGLNVEDNDLLIGPRIGVDYAGEDARLPYRFLLTNLKGIKKPPKIWEV
ncbi:MAG: DNA-3-methyladenine glycosylase [Bacteroidales bacterium]|nr:DNA-3-methyladenine glycosylase [Bacteroidales bacterium]MCF8404321.1 DNA-3-methyladenine glycosylase [Bacteroidales bacterium]